MKQPNRVLECWATVFGILWAVFMFTGCQTGTQLFADPGLPAGGVSDVFRPGDWVIITFSGTDSPLPTYQEVVKEDGTITPSLIGTVVVNGKTAGELQKELQQKYSKLYNNLTVTVISQGRVYYVTGEVRSPGPKPYLGGTDIVKAIATAGDFTEFANKKKVRLTHDGRTRIINVPDAIEDPQYHVPVYPGDKIVVPRRFF
jgi:protein involved in polysaccharide export with SLBB domain